MSTELDFLKLIKIEMQFLCDRPHKSPSEEEAPPPVADKILAMGLLYTGWNPKVRRFAAYGKWSPLGSINLSGIPASIVVENACLDQLLNDDLIAGFVGSEVRFALTRQADELVKKIFNPEMATLMLPSLYSSQ